MELQPPIITRVARTPSTIQFRHARCDMQPEIALRRSIKALSRPTLLSSPLIGGLPILFTPLSPIDVAGC
jgi:hypothetical protein